jgi:hypothetical protein
MSITPEAMIDEQDGALSASPGYPYRSSGPAAPSWIRAACVLTDRDPLLPVLVR